ncbi:sodium-independent sulfate anion transporter isoform X2 [Aethina tumida]|uniref:sodium-independent sulfate anion transporter isoform X2 n=1 Tax=Aethina tumida TaxID=116153 RepID=UPI00096B58FC|nr:sodium-independent sulfate anion transporter isoform X2 [Aethina tumida]
MIKKQVDFIRRKLPIFDWSPQYDIHKAVADLVAGITMGLTLIPQSLAYAPLAGLEPQYGLYSSICGGLTYVVFGTIPELNIAPTALLSLLTYSYTHNLSYNHQTGAVLLTFVSGVIELLCGVLQLGFLVDFVSTPVVAALTSAAAITISMSQVKNLLGLKFEAESFIEICRKVFEHISETQLWDTVLGLLCCIVLLLMRKLKDFGHAKSDNKEELSSFRKFLFFCSLSRNAVVVLFCAVLSYILTLYNFDLFALTSYVPSGFPRVAVPEFETFSESQNRTLNVVEMVKELGTGTFVLPFIAILCNVAIAKAFARGKIVDANQEMMALGLCNIFGSFFGSFPVNAMFTIAAVGNASGIKTQFAGIYTSAMVVLSLTYLTPYFAYIPKTTLSAVIMCAVLFMVEFATTKMIWKINKIDIIPFMVTLISCLVLGVGVGIIVGVCVDLVILLYGIARPKILFEKLHHKKEYLRVTPTSSISFPSAQYIRENIVKYNGGLEKNNDIIVIDCHRIHKLDFTGGKCFGDLVKDLKTKGKFIVFLLPHRNMEEVIKLTCDPSIPIVHYENEVRNLIEGKIDVDKTVQNVLEETTTSL